MRSKLEDSTSARITAQDILLYAVYFSRFYLASYRVKRASPALAALARTVEVSVFPRRYVSVFASRDATSIRTFSRTRYLYAAYAR